MDRIPGCADFRKTLQLNRRGLLRLGALGASGLTLGQLLQAESQGNEAASAKKKDTSVIILWMRGGPSQLELWDPKPDAPAEIRGEFGTIETKVPGIRLGEHLPLSAKIMDKWSIIRSMHFRAEDGLTDHSSGDQVCFTGYPAAKDPSGNISPSVGSVAKRQLQGLSPDIPAYVMIPRQVPGTDSAYLGANCKPFETQADPGNTESPFSVPNLDLSGGLSVDRIESRRQLVASLDQIRRSVDSSGQMSALDTFNQQAWEIVTGPKARQAFDLESEPRAVRERYGFPAPYTPRMRAGGDRPNWPQRLLLARRLVQAGVRLVTVDCRWWDTHDDNFWSLKNGFLPPWDMAYTALIEDLERTGMLDKTMVVAWGEMGRTPRVNATAGRDHWARVFSVAMAGGGIKGGRIVGSSDKEAAVPKDNPKISQDVLATLYRHLGVNTKTSYLDHFGRPLAVLPCGEPIQELF
ncbi:DUF1501 domain-containing protein [Anatilimnocola sp. NA78]|uniref:DUF1501 domain-containing protein n=1 Tax=Anatilimnocola sp. NA78 TaxID=3415683 RepID=UPI003CE4B627